MKKILSIMLSAVFCGALLIAGPDEMDPPGIGLDDVPGVVVEHGMGETGGDSNFEPCDDSFPPPGEAI